VLIIGDFVDGVDVSVGLAQVSKQQSHVHPLPHTHIVIAFAFVLGLHIIVLASAAFLSSFFFFFFFFFSCAIRSVLDVGSRHDAVPEVLLDRFLRQVLDMRQQRANVSVVGSPLVVSA
jgi:hypothetical protein